MKLKPPCKVDGVDCPRRYIGCRAKCEAWHEWLTIHAEETQKQRKNKLDEFDVTEFLVHQGERTRRHNQARVMRERRRK